MEKSGNRRVMSGNSQGSAGCSHQESEARRQEKSESNSGTWRHLQDNEENKIRFFPPRFEALPETSSNIKVNIKRIKESVNIAISI